MMSDELMTDDTDLRTFTLSVSLSEEKEFELYRQASATTQLSSGKRPAALALSPTLWFILS